MTQDTKHQHEGFVKRLVGRVRSSSKAEPMPPPSPTTTTTTTTPSQPTSPDIERANPFSTPNPKPRRLGTFSLPNASTFSRRSTTATKLSPAADLSLTLWNEAYDSLRHATKTANLVVAYEAIISNELPDNMKSGNLGMSGPSALGQADGDSAKKMELLETIAMSGLMKRRGSENSGADEAVRGMLNEVKGLVEGVWGEFPSVAVAWAGVCTMTPLLLETILRKPCIKTGLLHTTGRIPWYMHLASLLQDQSSSTSPSLILTHTSLITLYRKVLEFEMNCVCASASAWNNMAKHVVDWHGLDALVEEIIRMDAEMGKVVRGCRKGSIERWDEDLGFGEVLEGRGTERSSDASSNKGLSQGAGNGQVGKETGEGPPIARAPVSKA